MADNFAQLVKQQVDIVRVIGEYVRLDKAGAQNYRGLCPFHKEKTPSFSVHATQGFFHCFGCHVSGDVFTFVQKLENCSFPEAVRTVAQKAGIPLPKREFSSPEEAHAARERAQLLKLHETASEFFEKQLQSPEGSRAREYLAQRGVSVEGIRTFHIGYAPESFNALRELLAPTADAAALRASGLFTSKAKEDGEQTNLYSRFRKRITFPIRNEQGKVIAFTARALEANPDAGPKYLNSPETPLYSKSHVLFNLDLAKAAIRKFEFALLVEGQMDALSVFMAGIPNVLATSGTAFTESQVRLLGRFTRRVCVNFDPDTAGAAAAEKSISMLIEEGFEVKVLTLEGGLDPDRFVRERGRDAYINALKTAPRHMDYLIDRARQLFPARTPENKVRAINYLLPHIRRLPERIARDEFAADAAQKLGIDSSVLRKELQQAAAMRGERLQSPPNAPIPEAQRDLLRALMMNSDEPARKKARQLVMEKAAVIEEQSAGPLLVALAGEEDRPDLHSPQIPAQYRPLLAELLIQDSQQDSKPVTEWEVVEAVSGLELRSLERRLKDLKAEITAATRSGDELRVAELTRAKVDLDRLLQILQSGG